MLKMLCAEKESVCVNVVSMVTDTTLVQVSFFSKLLSNWIYMFAKYSFCLYTINPSYFI